MVECHMRTHRSGFISVSCDAPLSPPVVGRLLPWTRVGGLGEGIVLLLLLVVHVPLRKVGRRGRSEGRRRRPRHGGPSRNGSGRIGR